MRNYASVSSEREKERERKRERERERERETEREFICLSMFFQKTCPFFSRMRKAKHAKTKLIKKNIYRNS